MEVNRTEIEVRYQETDQMGVVYHANYLVWFEIGRTKYIEQVGFNYAEMEKLNYISPVIDIYISYKQPARYGETVTVETWLDAYDGIRSTYGYKIYNENGDLSVQGHSTHVIVSKDTFKPVMLRKVDRKWHEAYAAIIKGEK